jgi:DNA-directed RNA polymerase subunit omega
MEITQQEYDRLKIEDAIEKIPNRFELILAASQRARQLHAKHRATIPMTSRENVTALREIAAGNIGREMLRHIK